LRPHIIGCGDLQTLCQSIDSFKLPEGIQTKLLGDTVDKLHSDLQERLLLISHYQIQNLLSPAISQTYLPLEKLQLRRLGDSPNSGVHEELVPLHFVGCIVDILTTKLHRRISPDIYRGLVLEASQRIVSEHLLPMAEQA